MSKSRATVIANTLDALEQGRQALAIAREQRSEAQERWIEQRRQPRLDNKPPDGGR